MTFKMKSFQEIIKNIKVKGVEKLPDNAICDDSFDHWLRSRRNEKDDKKQEKDEGYINVR